MAFGSHVESDKLRFFMKPFTALTGTVWMHESAFGIESIFVILDGYFDLKVERHVGRFIKNKKVFEVVTLSFRNYLDLSTGKISGLSEDSDFNKSGKRIV